MSRLAKGGAAGGVGALMIMATAFIGSKEGLRTHAYRDSVGVWTVGYGETKNVDRHSYCTPAECKAMFGERLDSDFAKAVERCVPDAKDPKKMKDTTYVSFVSFAYNLGTAGFCKSSVARRWNAGDHEGACSALRLYVYGRGHRFLPGLANRRRDEQRLCMKGL